MNILGSVQKLYITKKNSSIRIEKDHLQVIQGGIIDDKFIHKNEKREILLSSTKSYQYAKSINMPIQESDLGENILVDFDIKSLQIGNKLKINNTLLEVAMECPICNHLSSIDKKFPKLIKDERGIFLKVIQEGTINKSDTVYLIQ